MQYNSSCLQPIRSTMTKLFCSIYQIVLPHPKVTSFNRNLLNCNLIMKIENKKFDIPDINMYLYLSVPVYFRNLTSRIRERETHMQFKPYNSSTDNKLTQFVRLWRFLTAPSKRYEMLTPFQTECCARRYLQIVCNQTRRARALHL